MQRGPFHLCFLTVKNQGRKIFNGCGVNVTFYGFVFHAPFDVILLALLLILMQ